MMAGFYGLESREVIRVKVKKCDGLMQPEYKKFSIDPQITSFEMLQCILAKAFSINGDFTLSYQARDSEGRELYLSMLSDWDMDAAFQCAADPYLKLKVDLKPFEEGLDDWDIIAPVDVPTHKISNLIDRNSLLGSITGTITSGVGKTMSHVQKAIGLKSDESQQYKPVKLPMSDLEFRNYLDSVGHLVKPQEFRLSIYQGGIEPSLRRVVWRHLLNVFPASLSGRERFDYLKGKEKEYYKLRDEWKEYITSGCASEEIKYVIQMVRKDVLRTDRNHKFYSGSDDNKNVISLFHLLVTYALTHPEVSYCQGMSDIASPLLVIQKDEAQAYLCFCGAMQRLSSNFNLDGQTINTKFQHLSDLLNSLDPEYFEYLKKHNASDLFFCYRWLLLELKREFPFDDALYMLEVMWSTLPPDPPENDLSLTDPLYSRAILQLSPSSPSYVNKQTVYSKLLSLRRIGHLHNSKEKQKDLANNSVNNNSERSSYDDSPVDDDRPVFPCMEDPLLEIVRDKSYSITESLKDNSVHEHSLNSINLINSSNGSRVHHDSTAEERIDEADVLDDGVDMNDCDDSQSQFHLSLEESVDSGNDSDSKPVEKNGGRYIPPIKGNFFSGMKKVLASPKRKPQFGAISERNASPRANDKSDGSPGISRPRSESCPSMDSKVTPKQTVESKTTSNLTDSHLSDCAEVTEYSQMQSSMNNVKESIQLLPPDEFGCGNPFLMFVCVTLLIQHRDLIMTNKMEYDELAMLFDKLVRRHNVHKVLHQARQLYSEYLKSSAKLFSGASSNDDRVSV